MKETIYEKFNTIRFRFFLMLCISTLLAILIFMFINNVVIKRAYIYSRINTSMDVIESLNNYYKGPQNTSLSSELRLVEIKNNVEIVIEDSSDKILYNTNGEILNIIRDFKENPSGKVKYKNDNTLVIEKTDNSIFKSSIVKSTIDNGNVVYIRISYAAINANVQISNRVMTIIGLILIILFSFLALILSKTISKPIVQLTNITEKMAKLDFSEKYRISDSGDEINQLGKNINLVSDKLEETINELKEHNDKLQSDIEEKSEIDKMRKQFISDVSHELKTPIGLIQGYSEGLIENVNEDEESRKFYAEVIRDEAQKMDIMVKRLLELMKLEYKEKNFKDEEFNLVELIKEEIRRETVNIKNKEIELEFDAPKKLIVYADQEYIEQVVNNFLTNAIKHCEKVKDEKKIIIRTEKQGKEKIRLFVYNSGKKIPKEYQNKIWGRFYKMDESRNRDDGSTGIGLALVKAIMNNYGNEYGVQNFENGVEFYCDINLKNKDVH